LNRALQLVLVFTLAAVSSLALSENTYRAVCHKPWDSTYGTTGIICFAILAFLLFQTKALPWHCGHATPTPDQLTMVWVPGAGIAGTIVGVTNLLARITGSPLDALLNFVWPTLIWGIFQFGLAMAVSRGEIGIIRACTQFKSVAALPWAGVGLTFFWVLRDRPQLLSQLLGLYVRFLQCLTVLLIPQSVGCLASVVLNGRLGFLRYKGTASFSRGAIVCNSALAVAVTLLAWLLVYGPSSHDLVSGLSSIP